MDRRLWYTVAMYPLTVNPNETSEWVILLHGSSLAGVPAWRWILGVGSLVVMTIAWELFDGWRDKRRHAR